MASVEVAARLPAPTLCNTTGPAPDPGCRYKSFPVLLMEPGEDGLVPYLTGPATPFAMLVERATTELFVLVRPVDNEATPVDIDAIELV